MDKIIFLNNEEIITITLIIIFTLFLIGLLIWRQWRDKFEKKELFKDNQAKEKEVVDRTKELKKEINTILLNLLNKLEDFNPSVGEFTMADLNKDKQKAIVKIKDNFNYQEVVLFGDDGRKIEKYLTILAKQPISTWNKNQKEILDFFKGEN